jgi:hypothetical protein
MVPPYSFVSKNDKHNLAYIFDLSTQIKVYGPGQHPCEHYTGGAPEGQASIEAPDCVPGEMILVDGRKDDQKRFRVTIPRLAGPQPEIFNLIV